MYLYYQVKLTWFSGRRLTASVSRTAVKQIKYQLHVINRFFQTDCSIVQFRVLSIRVSCLLFGILYTCYFDFRFKGSYLIAGYNKTWKFVACDVSGMENYYEVLGVSSAATSQELKNIFQQLVRQCHPDKTQLPDQTSRFLAISEAWKVLGNPELRKQYDAAWVQRCIAQSQTVQDNVSIEEFDVGADGRWVFPCRCGAEYELNSQNVEFRVDYLSCPSCSLCIAVQYS